MGADTVPEKPRARDLAHPFDAAAGDYDKAFTHTRLGRWLREAVWERVGPLFGPGDRVLELGCGTGTDAVWLAQRGVRIVATDASPAMLEMARRKATAASVDERIEFRVLDLNDMGGWTPGLTFDGLLTNFGVFNCVAEWGPAIEGLARWMRPGARAAMVVMGPCCPWEMAWHLLHGDVRSALRRFRGGEKAHIGSGATVPVWYPSPRRLRTRLTPFFQHVETAGIGVFLPPTELQHVVERWPGFFGRLAAWERRWSARFPCSWLNDHYLALFERDKNTL